MMEMKVRPQCQKTSSVLRVIKLFSCLTQLSIKFIKLINVIIDKIVGISLSICKIFQHLSLKARKVFILSVRVYAVIISKYATKIVGTQKRQVVCVHGTQDQKQSTFNTFKSAQ